MLVFLSETQQQPMSLRHAVTVNGTEQQAVFLVENVGGSEKSRL